MNEICEHTGIKSTKLEPGNMVCVSDDISYFWCIVCEDGKFLDLKDGKYLVSTVGNLVGNYAITAHIKNARLVIDEGEKK